MDKDLELTEVPGADLEVSRINQIQNLKFKIPVNNNPIGQVFVLNYSLEKHNQQSCS